MRELKFGRQGAAPGQAKHLVVLLHGYGADGDDLLGLSGPMGPHLPGTAFIAPDAPNPCSGNPFGREWFPIPWLDGSREEAARKGMEESIADLNAFLDARMEEEGVTPAETILLGFSQGTMMALHVGLRRVDPVAGIVGFSGALLGGPDLQAEIKSRPPVVLIHGDRDDVVPIQAMYHARDMLQSLGVPVTSHVSPGMMHGIANDGLQVAAAFLQRHMIGDAQAGNAPSTT